MAVISVSRQFGAGGWALSSAVADRLGYRLVGSEVIAGIAKEANVSVEWIRGVDKHAGDRLMRYLSKVVPSSFMERHIGESKSDFDEKKFVIFLQAIVKRIAEEDNIIILGQCSQYILQDNPNALHILLAANLEDRIKYLANLWKINEKEAKRLIRAREKRRDEFLKYFDKNHFKSPSLYHLIINTSKMTLEEAEDLVVDMVEKKHQKQGI